MVKYARVAQWQRNRLVIGRLVGSNPLSGWGHLVLVIALGEVPEWLIGAVCKIAALTGFAGSNPALSTISSDIESRPDISLKTRISDNALYELTFHAYYPKIKD